MAAAPPPVPNSEETEEEEAAHASPAPEGPRPSDEARRAAERPPRRRGRQGPVSNPGSDDIDPWLRGDPWQRGRDLHPDEVRGDPDYDQFLQWKYGRRGGHQMGPMGVWQMDRDEHERTTAGPPPEWDGENLDFKEYKLKARIWLRTTRTPAIARGLCWSRWPKVHGRIWSS